MSQVKLNDVVKVHYTGKLSDGQVFDSSANREPLSFQVGAGQVIKGFEDAIVGMEVEEEKSFTIGFQEAYGPVREDLIQEVSRTHLPDDLKPELGQELVAQQPNGQKVSVRVVKVDDQNITVDANHPLAGKDLLFDIKLVEIS